MKSITLPGLFDKFNLNTTFIDYCSLYKHQLINNGIQFTVYGSFSQDSWAGHRVTNTPYSLYRVIHEVLDKYYQLDTICRFDCSSLLFDEKDYNVFGRTALKIGENGSNQIEVSCKKAYDYLKENFPAYVFVGSELFNEFDDNIDFSILVRNSHNSTAPKNFPKNKIEKILNYPCEKCSTSQWSTCVSLEQTALATFSNQTCYQCKNYIQDIHIVSSFDELNNISRAQLADYGTNITRQLEEYIKAIILPEYQDEARLNITMQLNNRR